jgi:hypothetical protein
MSAMPFCTAAGRHRLAASAPITSLNRGEPSGRVHSLEASSLLKAAARQARAACVVICE